MSEKKHEVEDMARYEALAEQAERGELTAPEDAQTVRGPEAGSIVYQWTGTDDPEEAVRILASAAPEGRPRVGAGKRGPSPTLRARVSPELAEAVAQVREAESMSESELIRAAVARYVLSYEDAQMWKLGRPGQGRGLLMKSVVAARAQREKAMTADPDGEPVARHP